MNKKFLRICMLVIGVLMAWAAWLAYRASTDLVTLNVRNMDVRKVVKKIRWQTWESIFVHKEVDGKITLNVRKVPLEEVLNIIGDQTESRSTAIYPLYSKGKSLAALKKALIGEIDPVSNGWTNLQSRPFFRPGMFGEPPQNPSQRVSLQIHQKDVQFATLALGRFAQVRVVPEDGTSGNVNLRFNQTSVSEAVAQLAKQAHRKWTKLYSLRSWGGRGGGGPGEFARRGRGGEERRGEAGSAAEAIGLTAHPKSALSAVNNARRWRKT